MHDCQKCGRFGHTCDHKSHGTCPKCGHICHKEHVCPQFGERQVCPQYQGGYTCQKHQGGYICPYYLGKNPTQNTQVLYEGTEQIDPADAKKIQ